MKPFALFFTREIIGDDGGNSFCQNCGNVITDIIQTEIDGSDDGVSGRSYHQHFPVAYISNIYRNIVNFIITHKQIFMSIQ